MSSFRQLWSDLRERNVVRAAIAYTVAGWLVLQVLDTVGDAVGFPDWILTLVLTLLALGLPGVLAVAWIYEFTPEGLQREADLREAPRDPRIARRFDVVIALLLTAALGLLGFSLWQDTASSSAAASAGGTALDPVSGRAASGARTGDAPQETSIAVLPFTAFSSGEAEQHFADGLSNTLLSRLARLQEIKVISRASSFQYRGQGVDTREVGGDLGVANVLTGSVQRSGERLRIIAELVRAADGRQLWSQSFDRPRDDIFSIQDEISRAVVDALALSLTDQDRAQLVRAETTSPQAYELHVRALARLEQVPRYQDPARFVAEIESLIEMLDQALALDPGYAEAHRGKTGLYNTLAFVVDDPAQSEAYVELALKEVRRAMAIDPDDPMNLRSYGRTVRSQGDPETALAFYRLALRELPNDWSLHRAMAYAFMEVGQYDEAARQFAKARELNPAPGEQRAAQRDRFLELIAQGRYEDALDALLAEVDSTREPEMLAADLMELQSWHLGRHADAIRAFVGIGTGNRDLLGRRFSEAVAGVLLAVGRPAAAVHVLAPDSGVPEAVGASALPSELELSPLRRLSRVEEDFVCALARDAPCVIEAIAPRHPELSIGAVPGIIYMEHGSAIRLGLAYRSQGDLPRARLVSRAVDRMIDGLPEGAAHLRGLERVGAATLRGDDAGALEAFRALVQLPDGAFQIVPSLDSWYFDTLRERPEFDEIAAELERRQQVAGDEVVALLEDAGML